MLKKLLCCLALVVLGACADGARELQKPIEPLGDFKLGHAIVVTPNIVKGPVSRNATDEEWIAGLDKALETRFRRYEGEKFYHIGVSIEGYVLAQPGIPLVLSPKSVVIVKATVWDDAAGEKLNAEPEQITVLEAISPNTLVGSGLTQGKAVQLEVLSTNTALQIEKWLRRMQRQEGWFGGPEANAITAARLNAKAPRVSGAGKPPVAVTQVAAKPGDVPRSGATAAIE